MAEHRHDPRVETPEKPAPKPAAPIENTTPSAGPHATASLTNPDATPGAGALPATTPDDDADAGAG